MIQLLHPVIHPQTIKVTYSL